jgi:hypothetical protein
LFGQPAIAAVGQHSQRGIQIDIQAHFTGQAINRAKKLSTLVSAFPRLGK